MDMAVMDIFDDVYGLCRLLLEIDQEDVFWDIVAVLEKLTKNANIANLQRKIVSLKNPRYRRKQDEAAYLEEAGQFYETDRGSGSGEPLYDRQHALCAQIIRTCE